jgi:hypothetical protein
MAHPVVVVVDVQERLFNAMDAERRDDMVANVKILVSSARRLGVPVLVTEQYPKGLGRTPPEVRSLLGEAPPFEKTAFSCAEADGFMERLRALGAEHVVSIVADAVCSRRPANLEIGLGQARQAGAVVTATETVAFQLLGSADSDAFRELSKLLR